MVGCASWTTGDSWPAEPPVSAALRRPRTERARLALDFTSSAGAGAGIGIGIGIVDWLSLRPVVLRQGRTLAFVECHVWAQAPARASATFHFT